MDPVSQRVGPPTNPGRFSAKHQQKTKPLHKKWAEEIPKFLVYEEKDFEEIEAGIAELISKIRGFDNRIVESFPGQKYLAGLAAKQTAPEPSTALNTPPRKKPGESGRK